VWTAPWFAAFWKQSNGLESINSRQATFADAKPKGFSVPGDNYIKGHIIQIGFSDKGVAMLHYISDTLIPFITMVATALVFLQFQRHSLTRPAKATVADYLYKIARLTGTSEYEVFCKSAEEWPVSANMIEQDFIAYLQTGVAPYYVNDYIRKNRVHIDKLEIPLC